MGSVANRLRPAPRRMTLHARSSPAALPTTPLQSYRLVRNASSPSKAALPAEARGRASLLARSTTPLAGALAPPEVSGGDARDGGSPGHTWAQAQVPGRCRSGAPPPVARLAELLPGECLSSGRAPSAAQFQALDSSPDSEPSAASSIQAASGSTPVSARGGCPASAGHTPNWPKAQAADKAAAPTRMASQRSLGARAGGGVPPHSLRTQRAASTGDLDCPWAEGGATMSARLRQATSPQKRQSLSPQGPLRRRQPGQPPAEPLGSDAHHAEVPVEAAVEEKAKKGVDSGRSSVGRQSTAAPASRSPRARQKADTSPGPSSSTRRRDSSVLLLRADSVLSRLETSSSNSSLGAGSGSTSSSARGVPAAATSTGCIRAARARHKACVAHLWSIQELVEDLEAENAALRASVTEVQRQLENLQVEHDAAQCHLDATITLAVTPRTRRSLEAQKRLLQPALGVRLASSFVEARHQRTQKEKMVGRQLQREASEELHAPRSSTDARGARPGSPSPPPRGPPPSRHASGRADDGVPRTSSE